MCSLSIVHMVVALATLIQFTYGDFEFMRPFKIQHYRIAFLNESRTSTNFTKQSFSSSRHETEVLSQRTAFANSNTTVIFVPTFQATLLYDCAGYKNSCSPLFLSPLSPWTYQRVYERLILPSTVMMPDVEDAVDYPAFTCAPSPFSHIGHCNSVPARGALSELERNLWQHSDPAIQMQRVGYDWRQSMRTLLSMSSTSFTTSMTMALRRSKDTDLIIVAHGTACTIAANWIKAQTKTIGYRIQAFICGAPAGSGDATAALRHGTGLLTAGNSSHIHVDSCANVRDGRRVDFTVVDVEIGLSARRLRSLGHVSGVWDVVGPKLVSTARERMEFARRLPSVVEMAAGVDDIPSLPNIDRVLCINARNRQSNDNEGAQQCQQYFGSGDAEVVESEADAHDLTALFADTIRGVVGKT